jgi:hypothetical protein
LIEASLHKKFNAPVPPFAVILIAPSALPKQFIEFANALINIGAGSLTIKLAEFVHPLKSVTVSV